MIRESRGHTIDLTRMFLFFFFLVILTFPLQNCSEGLDESYAGDTAFANAVETFGGGHDDPISVAVGGSCWALLSLLSFAEAIVLFLIWSFRCLVCPCSLLFGFLLAAFLLVKFEDYSLSRWTINRTCDDKVYCCPEGDRDVQGSPPFAGM